MAYSERVLILTEAEQEVFYGNPQLTNNDQRYFFALNDKERKVANQLRGRRQRCMFVVLLGYTLQKLISQIVVSVHSGLVKRLNASLSNTL